MKKGQRVIRLANAPVSYGVFELARPDLVDLPTGEEIAKWVHDAGYVGVDLGPVGLFGTGSDLISLLARYELDLAGGWVDLPFSASDDEFAQALSGLSVPLDLFVLAAEAQPDAPPLPTIADSGTAARKAQPGGAPELTLTGDAWKIFTDRINQVAEIVASRGLEPTFHHHACTHVETPDEIDALLEATGIGLTFDSGHLLIGGGNPLSDFHRWAPRINHLHLKDAKTDLLREALQSAEPMASLWEKRVFVPLGDGDLAVGELVDAILASGFSGWLVVEQDVVPMNAHDVQKAITDQIINREALRKWFP
jgi:inosose dehydratase